MKHSALLLFVCLVLATTGVSPVSAITFDLRDASIEAIDEAPSFGLSGGRVNATFAANVGDLNRTASGFGINAPGAGDATDQIDDVNGTEIVSVSADAPVYVNFINVSLLGAGDEGSATVGGGTPTSFTTSGMVELGGVLLSVGDTVDVAAVMGNGYSFDSISLTENPLVRYDLRDASIEAIDEAPSFDLTIGGIKATFTANIGDLNRTASGFGVNAPGAGDATDQLDAVNGIETITVTFDTNVFLEGLIVSLLSGSDAGKITLPGGSEIGFSSSGFVNGAAAVINVGESIVISHVAGNGFSLDQVMVSAIPEPVTATLLIVGFAALAGRRRRARA